MGTIVEAISERPKDLVKPDVKLGWVTEKGQLQSWFYRDPEQQLLFEKLYFDAQAASYSSVGGEEV